MCLVKTHAITSYLFSVPVIIFHYTDDKLPTKQIARKHNFYYI